MIALVCDTPYQLMSAIMVSREIAPDEPMVFFINRYLYGREQVFNYKKEHPLVEDIVYYGRAQMSPAKLFPGLFKPNAILKSIEGYNPEQRFSKIIASRTAYMATYLMKAAHKENLNIPIYMIEEGADEYTIKFTDTRFTKACRILRQKTHIDCVENAYFSEPQLYSYKLNFPVKKVPVPDDTAKEIITSVFGLEEINENNPFEPYKCIILGQPVYNDFNNPNDTQTLKDLLNAITNISAAAAGAQNTVIKPHPLASNQITEGIASYSSKIPMEALLLSMNADSKFFVSAVSTAMLTPKLMFDYEPGLIFTYKILEPIFKKVFKDLSHLPAFYKFARGVMDSYRDKERCAVPENLKELEEAAARVNARIG